MEKPIKTSHRCGFWSLFRECVRAGACDVSGCRQKRGGGLRTYHSPHAVRGGGADRVVVGVCCCIDSAVAAWNREDAHSSVTGGRAEHLRTLPRRSRRESTLSSHERNQLLPSPAPRAPTSHKVLQKGEFKGWRIILVFSLSS